MSDMLTAIINEAECVGCARCIPACPVDAIVGTAKHAHTVLLDECIGCKLCVNPCPVDCITITPLAERLPSDQSIDKRQRAQLAKKRHQARLTRLKQQTALSLPEYSSPTEKKETIRNEIKSALQRARSHHG